MARQVPTLTDRQMQEWLRLLGEGEAPGSVLGRVGRALAEASRMMLGGAVAYKRVLVMAGLGEKGAAGMEAARWLHEGGARVQLVLAGREDGLHAAGAGAYRALLAQGVTAWGLSLSDEAMAEQEPIAWTSADLIVDALLGGELRDNPYGEASDLIRLINATRCPILSLDVPSGLSGDEATIWSPCVEATVTLALGLPRQSLAEGWPVVGEVWLADLGATPALLAQMGLADDDLFEGQAVRRVGPARLLKQERRGR